MFYRDCLKSSNYKATVRREKELEELLKREKIMIMFLVEADSSQIKQASEYTIKGYKTIIPEIEEKDGKIRVVCLTHESLNSRLI